MAIPDFMQKRYNANERQIFRFEEYFYIHEKNKPFEKTSALPYEPKIPVLTIAITVGSKTISRILSNYDLDGLDKRKLLKELSSELEELIAGI